MFHTFFCATQKLNIPFSKIFGGWKEARLYREYFLELYPCHKLTLSSSFGEVLIFALSWLQLSRLQQRGEKISGLVGMGLQRLTAKGT